MQEEKTIDIKGTLEQFVKADEPELSQEEAIMKYSETNIKKKKYNVDDDDDNTEESEHLKRIKQELLASLKRVKELEKKIFRDKDVLENATKKLKVKSDAKGGFSAGKSIKEQSQQPQMENQKERE